MINSKLNKIFKNKTILFTGGTGSLGNEFTRLMLEKCKSFKKLIIFSRDEFKQYNQRQKFKSYKQFDKLRFFLGDVRDKKRVNIALNGVDIIIHAAALKQIDIAEYNPTEFIETNINGTKNIIEACFQKKIKAILISTDKACMPVNLYGATKLCAEKLFIAANNYIGKSQFFVLRYGNVLGSRGSVLPLFLKQKFKKEFSITDTDMTRFNINLPECVDLIAWTLENSPGSSISIPKIPAYKIIDLAKSIDKNKKLKIIGIRPGEKIHEELINKLEPYHMLEFKSHYLLIDINKKINSLKFQDKFQIIKNPINYNSFNSKQKLSIKDLKFLINK